MSNDQRGDAFPRLVEIMQRLLAKDGCPWDQEQTFQTLRTYVIEEAYEVVDAIDGGKSEDLCEELGDLLLQIAFLTELARKENQFGPDDVINGICDKLVHRHPHVFGDVKVSGSSEVSVNWERLKSEKKQGRGVLEGIPSGLPSLLRAMRVGQRASRVGFDWPDSSGARAKVDEELGEFDAAIAERDEEGARRELGDLLFSIANLARKCSLEPESALRDTLSRFAQRMDVVEEEAKTQKRDLRKMSPPELDNLWNLAKQKLS